MYEKEKSSDKWILVLVQPSFALCSQVLSPSDGYELYIAKIPGVKTRRKKLRPEPGFVRILESVDSRGKIHVLDEKPTRRTLGSLAGPRARLKASTFSLGIHCRQFSTPHGDSPLEAYWYQQNGKYQGTKCTHAGITGMLVDADEPGVDVENDENLDRNSVGLVNLRRCLRYYTGEATGVAFTQGAHVERGKDSEYDVNEGVARIVGYEMACGNLLGSVIQNAASERSNPLNPAPKKLVGYRGRCASVEEKMDLKAVSIVVNRHTRTSGSTRTVCGLRKETGTLHGGVVLSDLPQMLCNKRDCEKTRHINKKCLRYAPLSLPKTGSQEKLKLLKGMKRQKRLFGLSLAWAWLNFG
ncbi:hypothetical protein C8R43DRAFT_1190417 [Mycena crocata]|nr:hypothetical protein C8R43DRAFT_1190417 [Mycena crocata]